MSDLTVIWLCPRCGAEVPLQAYPEGDARGGNEGMRRQIVHWESEACKTAKGKK